MLCSMWVLRPRRVRGLRSGGLQGECDVLRGQRAAPRAPLARGQPARQLQVQRLPPRLLVHGVPHRLPLRVVRQYGQYLSSSNFFFVVIKLTVHPMVIDYRSLLMPVTSEASQTRCQPYPFSSPGAQAILLITGTLQFVIEQAIFWWALHQRWNLKIIWLNNMINDTHRDFVNREFLRLIKAISSATPAAVHWYQKNATSALCSRSFCRRPRCRSRGRRCRWRR